MQADIFDRPLWRARRDAVAHDYADVDYAKRDACAIAVDRLRDIKQAFPRVLEVGAHHGVLADMLDDACGVETLFQCDVSEAMLQQAGGMRVVSDESALPFAPASFDAVISAASLHWVNDLAGVLMQCRQLLKPDGLLVAVLPGPETLFELRNCFAEVEAKHGGLRPHISPFPEIRDAGNLLQRCGFALPVGDRLHTVVEYSSPQVLMRELKQMGEANALVSRDRRFYPKTLMQEVCELYVKHYSTEQGRIRATIEWVVLTGRAPDASAQQQPAKRGSGQTPLTDFLH